VQYCQYLWEVLEKDPDVQNIKYQGDGNTKVMVRRFVACISPSICESLPTHDLFEIEENSTSVLKALPISWTMEELCKLYVVARCMDADEVCDMVMDRWYEEFHRHTPRVTFNQFGERETFDILDFGPDFIDFLYEYDDVGASNLFAEIIITKSNAGWKMLYTHSLACWNKYWKQVLIRKLEFKELHAVAMPDVQAVCENFHHHGEDAECYKVQALTSSSVLADKLTENLDGVQAAIPEFEYLFWYERKTPAPSTNQATAINRKRKRTNHDDDDADAQSLAKCKKVKALEKNKYAMISVLLPLPSFLSARRVNVADNNDYDYPPPPQRTRQIQEERFLYGQKKLDEAKKDFGKMANIKRALVQKKLEEFEAAGYDVDNTHIPKARAQEQEQDSDEESDDE
jgi:hypothetical protein